MKPHVLGYTVKFEPPHPNREIPQCINCQRYGHTKGFCNRKARCVKFAGDHPTFNFPRKTKSENATCALYEGNDPAYYKGCTVDKDLQKDTSPHMEEGNNNQTTTRQFCTHTETCTQSETVQLRQNLCLSHKN